MSKMSEQHAQLTFNETGGYYQNIGYPEQESIFLVVGQSGSYEGIKEWNVTALSTRNAADQLVNTLETIIINNCEDVSDITYEESERIKDLLWPIDPRATIVDGYIIYKVEELTYQS